MNSKEEAALRSQIIKRLANHERMSDITLDICKMTGLSWAEAEAFVREVAIVEEKTVRRKRSPVLIGLGVVIFFGGVGLMFMSAFSLSSLVIFYRTNLPELLSTVQILLLLMNEAPFALGLGSLGLAMVIGSLIGMRDVWTDWLH